MGKQQIIPFRLRKPEKGPLMGKMDTFKLKFQSFGFNGACQLNIALKSSCSKRWLRASLNGLTLNTLARVEGEDISTKEVTILSNEERFQVPVWSTTSVMLIESEALSKKVWASGAHTGGRLCGSERLYKVAPPFKKPVIFW